MAEPLAAPLEEQELEQQPAAPEQQQSPSFYEFMSGFRKYETKLNTIRELEEEAGLPGAAKLWKRVESGEISSARAIKIAKEQASPLMLQMTKDHTAGIMSPEDFVGKYGDYIQSGKASEKDVNKFSSIYGKLLVRKGQKEVEERRVQAELKREKEKGASFLMLQMTKDHTAGTISSKDFVAKYEDYIQSGKASEKDVSKFSTIYNQLVIREGKSEVEVRRAKEELKKAEAERAKKLKEEQKAATEAEKAEIEKEEARLAEIEAREAKEDTFLIKRAESTSLLAKLSVKLYNPASRMYAEKKTLTETEETLKGEVETKYNNAMDSMQTFLDDPYADTTNRITKEAIDWEGAIAQIYEDVNDYVNTLAAKAPAVLHDAIGVAELEAIEWDDPPPVSGEKGATNVGKLRDALANQMLNLVNGFIKSALATADPPNVEQATEAAENEIKRQTKDGRTAIFNADTKEFIRYE